MTRDLAYCQGMLVELARHKQNLVAEAEAWPLARRQFRPSSSSWSAVQMIEHLLKTEAAILEAMQVGLANPRLRGPRDILGTWFVDRIFQTARKVKAPGAATQIFPSDAPDWAELLGRWQTVRVDLTGFVAALRVEQTRQAIFRHPVAGWMRAGDALRFMAVHLIHHGFQLERIEQAWKGAPDA